MSYAMPPAGIAALVDAAPTPSFSLDPTRCWALLLSQPSLPPIEEIAADELKLAGIRIDPARWTRSHLAFGHAPKLRRLLVSDTPIPIGQEPDLEIEGLPSGHGVRYMCWRPGGGALAFVVRPQRDATQLELWCAEFDASTGTGGQRCIARKVDALEGRTLNAVQGQPQSWTSDGRLLVKVVPLGHPAKPPAKPLAPAGPIVQVRIVSKLTGVGQSRLAHARTGCDHSLLITPPEPSSSILPSSPSSSSSCLRLRLPRVGG
jgi:hypothetical protein